MKIQIIFYSMYGHVWQMAEAVAEGARQVEGAEVKLYQVPELVPEEALVRSGAKAARERFNQIEFAQPEVMMEADAIIFGTPTRLRQHVCADAKLSGSNREDVVAGGTHRQSRQRLYFHREPAWRTRNDDH